jgi:hypothetical protein
MVNCRGERRDQLKAAMGFLPITSDAMLCAAEFWADARRGGRPTASDDSLDGVSAPREIWNPQIAIHGCGSAGYDLTCIKLGNDNSLMPTISHFFGIAIRMYYDDHPPPHFHAYYGNDAAKIDVETLQVTEGHIPRRALALVVEWAEEHRDELLEDWLLAEGHQPLNPIAPLD